MWPADGTELGVCITTPPGYGRASTQEPVVYVLAGNWAVEPLVGVGAVRLAKPHSFGENAHQR